MTNVEPSYSGRSIAIRLSVLCLGMFAVATNAFSISGLLPEIAAGLDTSLGSVSLTLSWYAIVVAAASPAIAVLLSSLSRSTLMVAGAIVVAVGGLLTASAADLTGFTIGRIVAGLGGAALVPAASAAAAVIGGIRHRGIALAAVAGGASLATAVGAPVATAVGTALSWRVPMYALCGIALLVALGILATMRGLGSGEQLTLAQRLAPLRNPPIIAALTTNALLALGFNLVYVFSSVVAAEATGGDGRLLAVLLLCYGVAGVAGTAMAGPLTDRYGNRRLATIALVTLIGVYALIAAVRGSMIVDAVLFAIWGAVGLAAQVPVQHRLVEIDPPAAGITLSWFATAMYVGIALAPIIAAPAVAQVGGPGLAVIAAAFVAVALAVFQLVYRQRPGVG